LEVPFGVDHEAEVKSVEVDESIDKVFVRLGKENCK
jgi:hypothetical protein